MAEAVEDASGGQAPLVLGNGYGGFVALQMAIRHPAIAARFIFADCGAAFSEDGRQAFRNMGHMNPREHGKGPVNQSKKCTGRGAP